MVTQSLRRIISLPVASTIATIAVLLGGGNRSHTSTTLARSFGISLGLFDTYLTRISCKEVLGIRVDSASFCTGFKLGKLGKVLDCKGFAKFCVDFVADVLFCETDRLRVRFPSPLPNVKARS
jgi:hypothetical protein